MPMEAFSHFNFFIIKALEIFNFKSQGLTCFNKLTPNPYSEIFNFRSFNDIREFPVYPMHPYLTIPKIMIIGIVTFLS